MVVDVVEDCNSLRNEFFCWCLDVLNGSHVLYVCRIFGGVVALETIL